MHESQWRHHKAFACVAPSEHRAQGASCRGSLRTRRPRRTASRRQATYPQRGLETTPSFSLDPLKHGFGGPGELCSRLSPISSAMARSTTQRLLAQPRTPRAHSRFSHWLSEQFATYKRVSSVTNEEPQADNLSFYRVATLDAMLLRQPRADIIALQLHVLYFTIAPAIGASVFYGLKSSADLAVVDALFMSYSAATGAGMETVLMATLTRGQQIVIFVGATRWTDTCIRV